MLGLTTFLSYSKFGFAISILISLAASSLAGNLDSLILAANNIVAINQAYVNIMKYNQACNLAESLKTECNVSKNPKQRALCIYFSKKLLDLPKEYYKESVSDNSRSKADSNVSVQKSSGKRDIREKTAHQSQIPRHPKIDQDNANKCRACDTYMDGLKAFLSPEAIQGPNGRTESDTIKKLFRKFFGQALLCLDTLEGCNQNQIDLIDTVILGSSNIALMLKFAKEEDLSDLFATDTALFWKIARVVKKAASNDTNKIKHAKLDSLFSEFIKNPYKANQAIETILSVLSDTSQNMDSALGAYYRLAPALNNLSYELDKIILNFILGSDSTHFIKSGSLRKIVERIYTVKNSNSVHYIGLIPFYRKGTINGSIDRQDSIDILAIQNGLSKELNNSYGRIFKISEGQDLNDFSAILKDSIFSYHPGEQIPKSILDHLHKKGSGEFFLFGEYVDARNALLLYLELVDVRDGLVLFTTKNEIVKGKSGSITNVAIRKRIADISYDIGKFLTICAIISNSPELVKNTKFDMNAVKGMVLKNNYFATKYYHFDAKLLSEFSDFELDVVFGQDAAGYKNLNVFESELRNYLPTEFSINSEHKHSKWPLLISCRKDTLDTLPNSFVLDLSYQNKKLISVYILLPEDNASANAYFPTCVFVKSQISTYLNICNNVVCENVTEGSKSVSPIFTQSKPISINPLLFSFLFPGTANLAIASFYKDSLEQRRIQSRAYWFIAGSCFIKIATIAAAGYFDYEAITHINNDALRLRNRSFEIGLGLDFGVACWSFCSATKEINKLRR